ncbi:MAG: LysR family transcriptional regulator [Roseburia sp.]|nr:LysR family transcriptional regulator [Roseburia sp.]MCM1279714.1 LysR family transcriptional regulator [Robinsoniella sp.]
MENNLHLYYIFYTVSLHKNISGAAKELFISQPAISKAISKLEQNLNTKLFTRSSRGVTLTFEGELLFEQVKKAFLSIKYGEQQLKRAADLGVATLSIGVSTTLCKYVLLPYLKQFIKDNPHIKVSISCQSSLETIAAIEKGTLDIGLVGIPANQENLVYVPIAEIQDTFIATKTYLKNLKIREGTDKNHLFQNAAFMMLNKENMSRKFIDSYLSKNQIEIGNLLEIDTMDLLIEFAKIDLGIACVIRNFVEEELKQGTLVEIPLKHAISKRKIGFVYEDSEHVTDSMKHFISYFPQ